MKLALSVLTIVSLMSGGAFAADNKKDSRPVPAARSAPAQAAPRAEPAAPRQAAPRAEPAAPRQAPAAPRQAPSTPRTEQPVSRARTNPAPAQQQRENKSTTTHAEPAKTAPAKTAPAKTEPVKTVPAKGEPSKEVKPPQTGNQSNHNPSAPAHSTSGNGNQGHQPSQPVAHTPVIHTPAASKPVAAKPTQIKQQKAQETAAVKTKVPAAVAAKIPAGSTAKINKNNTVTVRDANGNTKVLDATTGKQRMSYNANTGKSVYTPPSGAKTVVSGNTTTRTAPNGFRQVETRGANNTKVVQTTFHGADVTKTYTSKNVYKSETVIKIKNVTVINETRNYVVINNGYGRFPVYQPTWWGAPRSWVFGGVVVFDAFYAPRYWGPSGFVTWNNPWSCPSGGCWASNWDWSSDAYYSGYYVRRTSYDSLALFMADRYVEQQLQYDRWAREAALEADANYQAELDAYAAQNSPALNQGNSPISDALLNQLGQQQQAEVAATYNGQQLMASDMVNANSGEGDGHLFPVSDPLSESTMVGDNTYQCNLGHGDFLQQDSNSSLDQEPIPALNDDGSAQVDQDGNPVYQTDDGGNVLYNTFVTLTVAQSKYGDCAIGQDVVVQLDTLQTMVDDESAQAQTSMQEALRLNVGR